MMYKAERMLTNIDSSGTISMNLNGENLNPTSKAPRWAQAELLTNIDSSGTISVNCIKQNK